VRSVFANPDHVLVPNQTVILIVQEQAGENQPIVPQTAVLQDQQGRFVFVLGSDNTVAQRRITTGEGVRNGWAVLQGLQGGERVVVQGTQRLSEGMLVAPAQGTALGTAP
jgi:membrane fusion protein (multidrug efflux system)